MKRYLVLILLLAFQTVSAQTLTLRDCIRYSESGNASLKSSELDVLSARAQRTEARLEYLPKVSVTAFGYKALHPLLEITLKDVLGNSDAATVKTELPRPFRPSSGATGSPPL